jgi:hypothetical protein
LSGRWRARGAPLANGPCSKPIRRILTASARRLAPGDRDDNFGSGLIDPLKALQMAEPRTATTTPPPAPTPTLRQR